MPIISIIVDFLIQLFEEETRKLKVDRLKREERSAQQKLEMTKLEIAKLEQQKQKAMLDLLRVQKDAFTTKLQSMQQKHKHDQDMQKERTELKLQRERDFAKKTTLCVETPAGGKLYLSNDVDLDTLTQALQGNRTSRPSVTG